MQSNSWWLLGLKIIAGKRAVISIDDTSECHTSRNWAKVWIMLAASYCMAWKRWQRSMIETHEVAL
jgi:hypothetical protein